jgi:hypothetical protein
LGIPEQRNLGMGRKQLPPIYAKRAAERHKYRSDAERRNEGRPSWWGDAEIGKLMPDCSLLPPTAGVRDQPRLGVLLPPGTVTLGIMPTRREKNVGSAGGTGGHGENGQRGAIFVDTTSNLISKARVGDS